ncbi:MAG TPA: PIN domain-containing protein [Anaeromyxobacteraceae bacterium]|nr:PIN domain-containing protein [Anaeromyxobacteraceae bacterium]
MGRVFVDTSAAYALLDAGDAAHARARRAFGRLRDREDALVTTSYVLVETCALVLRRLGLPALRTFREEFSPLLDVVWVDARLHDEALDLLLARRRASLSLVDAASFVAMRRAGIEEAFAFDRHFQEEGFAFPG